MVRDREAARWRRLEVETPGGLDDLLSDPNFRQKLLKRIEEGWAFEKIEPMSTEEIFVRLNRLGVTVTPEDFRQATQRHESAERLAESGTGNTSSVPKAVTTRTWSELLPSCFGNG